MNDYQYYFFDLDDTLCNYKSAKEKANIRINRQLMNYGIDIHLFKEKYISNEVKLMNSFLEGKLNKIEYRTRRYSDILNFFGVNNVDEKAKELNLIFMEEGNIKIKIFDDVIPFMKKIKKAKKKIAIITNGPTDGQMSKLKVTGLLDYIDHIYISEEVGAAKPSKVIFNFAMHDLGALPKESVMFGDNIKEDIFGAKSVGMSDILVNRFNKNINYNNQIKNFFELDNI